MPRRASVDPILARIGLPNRVSQLSGACVAILVLGGLLALEPMTGLLFAARAGVLGAFDGFFVFVVNAALGIVVVVALHPSGRLRLGREDARPEFSRWSWFAMLFSAGLASGLLYWATAEPIIHLERNPLQSDALAAGTSPERLALRLTLLHWGVHGWALYVVSGLAISIYAYRHGRPLTFRTALFPILGVHQIDRWPGRLVDLLAVFGTIAGVATSIGLSAASIDSTLASLVGLEVDPTRQIAIVLGVGLFGIVSARSGVGRGIRRLSEINLWVSAILLGAFLGLGPTRGLLSGMLASLADFVVAGLPTGLFVGQTPAERVWQGDWTVFYWAWWLAWTPFVSLFIARISKGRTIREFVLGVLLVPACVTFVWMTVIGGTAIHQEMSRPGSVSEAVAENHGLGLVAVIEQLGPHPVTQGLVAVAAFLLLTWLVTSLDSATLVLCHLVDSESSAAARVFWGCALAAVAALLLRAGGLSALQAASIVLGLPLAFVVILLCGGLLRDLARGRF